MGLQGYRRAVDLDVGLHPDLHAGLVADRRGDELVAGRPDDLPRQLHRAGADGAQRPRRHEVRHPVPGLLPRVVRHPRAPTCPALLRALVACGWFGIQTWIGGEAIYKIAGHLLPGAGAALPQLAWLGINAAQLACFLFFWAINMFVIYKGIESIRFLLNIKAPLLIALGLALLGLGLRAGRRLRADAVDSPRQFDAGPAQGRAVLAVLLPGADRR